MLLLGLTVILIPTCHVSYYIHVIFDCLSEIILCVYTLYPYYTVDRPVLMYIYIYNMVPVKLNRGSFSYTQHMFWALILIQCCNNGPFLQVINAFITLKTLCDRLRYTPSILTLTLELYFFIGVSLCVLVLIPL